MLDTYVILLGITALLLQTIGKIRDKTRRQCKCAGEGWALQGVPSSMGLRPSLLGCDCVVALFRI